MKILIVGGVAGGATAAARLRRIDETAEIIMIERGPDVSFANCGLPYHISGTIPERESLLVQTPEGFKDRFNVNVKIKTEALKIDRKNKSLLLKDLTTGKEYNESYDYLILSPGAEPIVPPFEGVDSERIFTLRNIPDLDKIMKKIKEERPKRAVVIGGGFIGIEVAENLLERGIKVTLIELADQILAPIDYEMAAMIHSHMKDKEIELYLKDAVTKFEDKEEYTLVYLKSGKRIKCDMVVMAIGVKPETKLAVDAGLDIGERKGIAVNEYLQTNDENIYALGDAIEVTHYINKQKALIPLAGPANRQGRIVADNILKGAKTPFKGTQGTSILKAFDMTAGATGMNEKLCKFFKFDYLTTITHGSSHASYYPGATPVTVKLIYQKDGTILGAQAVGTEGVDKRIDVIATAIRGGLKVWDLEEIELAYAPPFGSAKDPVNIAGYVANNVINGDMEIIHWHEVDSLDLSKSQLLDVRTKEEFELGTIKDALNIDLNTLRDNLGKLDKSKEVVVFCQVGLRGYVAYRILIQNGFKVRNLTGGYKTYSYAVDKQENPDIFDYEQIKPLEIQNSVKCQDEFDLVNGETIRIDACGLQCPGPIMKTFKTMEEMTPGDYLEIKSSDIGFKKDVVKWAEKTGNEIKNVKIEKGIITALIRKGLPKKLDSAIQTVDTKNGKTIVVFSNDLDKVIASLIIASGAMAMGKKVTLFFTFWGLNVLRMPNPPKVKKNIIEKAFGMMMPRGINKLTISQMNMGGMGTMLIKGLMKKHNVDSAEQLLNNLIDGGASLIACNMSMDLMGIRHEELISGVELGGVATYLGEAEDAFLNLFI